MNQRGNVAVYLLFSIVVATAAGYGVYVVMRDRSRAEASAEPEPPVEVAHVQAPAPVAAPGEPMSDFEPPPEAVDVAERDAVAPNDIEDPPKDTVVLGRPGVSGALEAAKVERTFKRYLVRYDRCMRKTHERYRMRRGQLRLTFVIAADGNVAYATARATVEDELATCVVDVVKKLHFDKPTDGGQVKVVYPMLFVPAEGGDAGDPYPNEQPADPWAD